jgi:glycosyltransferase involved in cell wall biosynthesis
LKTQVVIVQRRLTHYRVPLFERLKLDLEQAGVRLRLIHGQPTPSEENKCDSGFLQWAEQVNNHYWRIGDKYLCWQPLPSNAHRADLIIITQENSMLSNYPVLFRRRFGGHRVAFWGHGANLQSRKPKGLKERFKRWTTRQVDWWFAYTDLSVELVRLSGFPAERITNLENAIDTRNMLADIAAVDQSDVAALRGRLGWEEGHVGLFLGSLHADKRLDFLFQAADCLHADDPLFRLLIIGDGPLREQVEAACAARPWCVWVGAKTGGDKALYLAVANVMLNPGLVGLGILDSFVSGVPMVTTDCSLHSPEIAYLHHDENGLMTRNTLEAFVAGVRYLLENGAYRTQLVAGCRKAARHYTLENMAQNFREGIIKALVI